MTNLADAFYDTLADGPVRPNEVREIRAAAEPASPPEPAPVQARNNYPRPYANERLNSRVAALLAPGRWEVRWKAELVRGLQPAFTLQAGERIVLKGEGQWQLFDLQGHALGAGGLGEGVVVLDEENDLFYTPDPSGLVSVHRLNDGQPAFSMNAFGGDAFRRDLLVRRGQRLLVVSVEHKVQPHGGHVPNLSAIEVYDLGLAPQVNEFGLLASARVQARLTRESVLLLTALHGDTLIVAGEEHIYLADWNLHLWIALEGPFLPLAMSLDEAGRIYLIVRIGEEDDEREALWVLTPEGERLLEVVLPERPDVAYAPPAIGYDHQVYVVQGDSILSISPGGEVRWRQHAGGPVAGAVVTADDRLLVAGGGVLSAFDDAGERDVLFFLEGDRWMTPPVLADGGRIYVATQHHLYCLQQKP